MAKLTINPFARDLITHAKNLTTAQQKEAQIARGAINQGMMPVLPESGKFVMLSDGKRAVCLNNKTMSEDAFVTGLVQLGKGVGVNADDVLGAYTGDSAAMGLCNTLQELTEKAYAQKSADDINNIIKQIVTNLKNFGSAAREAKVNLGVIVAVEQQTQKDLAKLAEIAKNKTEEENEK